MSLRRAEHGLQKTEQELERLKFGAAQLYVVLKKHNLLSLKESSQADSERLKTAEIIKGYQDRMKSKDDEITVLKHRITRLEERAGAELPPMQPATLGLAFPGLGERRTSRAAPHLGPSGPKIGRPNSRNGSIMPIAAQGTTESISLNIPEPEEDFSKADELQKNYEAKIEELKRVQALELHKATKEKDAAQKYWETRLKSLSRLQKSDTLHKLLKRQSDILAMLAKSKKPPPKKDMELTAFIFGRRLRELPINIAAREEVEETEEYEEIYQDWEDYEDDGEAEQGGIASISLIEKISDNPNPDSTNRRKSVKVRGSTVKPKTSKIPEIGDPLADSSSSTKTGP